VIRGSAVEYCLTLFVWLSDVFKNSIHNDLSTLCQALLGTTRICQKQFLKRLVEAIKWITVFTLFEFLTFLVALRAILIISFWF
jgi:hypothetical protein